ncbi:NAD(P)H-binding protein [Klugiella xanthotipulae]|uniref:Uncharacterized protein YbjT (DUF2867 family) n=1 Tax=Klugiella xanthotipulae TaxID=244735 RepID=A0A543I6M3_9MICO|nr:NAD(P)H-binding protein [Klugiella xanthotipulae]TQM66140.1 uncharacterized protein YbjT (DUF2867 family) [Klugiella xanthotipulae]
MRVTVLGGTGRIGRRVAIRAAEMGHHVTVLARHEPREALPKGIGMMSGSSSNRAELRTALAGAHVVFDLTDAVKHPQRLVAGARAVTDTIESLGQTTHVVVLSILNADTSNWSYYAAKEAQADVYTRASFPSSVLICTQFHSFLDMIFSRARGLGVILAPSGTSFQSVDEDEVADELCTALSPDPRAAPWVMRGPETLTGREAAERFKRTTRSRRMIVGFRLPGKIGAFFRTGFNLTSEGKRGYRLYRP